MISKVILVSLVSLVAAQNAAQKEPATISIPWVGDIDSDFTDVYASVVAANPTATTLALACAPSTACGLFPAETLIFGPSTYNLNMGDPSPGSDFTATMDCMIAKSAVCKEMAGGTEANFPGSSTETYDAESVGTVGLVITAGVHKLLVQAEPTTTEAATSLATLYKVHKVSGFIMEQQNASTSVAVGSGSVSQTGSAAVAEATGGANVKAVGGGGLLSIAAGVIGGLLL